MSTSGERDVQDVFSQSTGYGRGQWGDGHLQVRERGLGRNQTNFNNSKSSNPWAWLSSHVMHMSAHALSCVQLLATPWTEAHQAPPCDFPAKNTGAGCHFLLQGIFSIQRLNPHFLNLLHWQPDSLLRATWEAIHVNITKRNNQIYQRSSSRNFCLILLIFKDLYIPKYRCNIQNTWTKRYTHMYMYIHFCVCTHTHLSFSLLLLETYFFLMDLFFFFLEKCLNFRGASLVAQMVKNLHAMQEAWVRSLGWEDPLEKGTATHSSMLAWRIPQTFREGLFGWTRNSKFYYFHLTSFFVFANTLEGRYYHPYLTATAAEALVS